MRRLTHLLMSPACRLVRLALAEKRLTCDLKVSDDPLAHVPAFTDITGERATGLWAIIDLIENEHPDPPLVPADPRERAEALRIVDWAMTKFHDEATRRIVFEKGAQAHTGHLTREPPNMATVRSGRQALRIALGVLGPLAEARGFLACREITLADLAVAAHVSALDYYGEIPWAEHPAITEWYGKMKSRPSFRSLLADRVPGQPPVIHYAELDF